MFLNKDQEKLSNEFLSKGYLIKKVHDKNALNLVYSQFEKILKKNIKKSINKSIDHKLNYFHKIIEIKKLNNFKLNLMKKINSNKKFREAYFLLARPYIENLVGNELVMQRRINLSIQLPKDKSALLPVHADTWSGDSPFEVVLWVPLVDCYNTKSMFILPPNKLSIVRKFFKKNNYSSSKNLFNLIKPHVKWINIKYGEILIFNQSLPHGNIVNQESETRWSMNCRFKSLYSPYGDKKLGEFFTPITILGASKAGMEYRFPND